MDYYRIAAMTFVRAQQLGGYARVCFVWLRVKPEPSHSEPVSGEYPLVAAKSHRKPTNDSLLRDTMLTVGSSPSKRTTPAEGRRFGAEHELPGAGDGRHARQMCCTCAKRWSRANSWRIVKLSFVSLLALGRLCRLLAWTTCITSSSGARKK